MKRQSLLFILLLATAASSVQAAPTGAPTARKSVFAPKTEHSFEGLDVNGRYRSAMESVVTIENEKVLDDLLGARTNFKDRVRKQAGMR